MLRVPHIVNRKVTKWTYGPLSENVTELSPVRSFMLKDTRAMLREFLVLLQSELQLKYEIPYVLLKIQV